MIVGEEIPGVSVGAVVFSYGAPLAFAQIGAPFLPCRTLKSVFLESLFFGWHRLGVLFPSRKNMGVQRQRTKAHRVSNSRDLVNYQHGPWLINTVIVRTG